MLLTVLFISLRLIINKPDGTVITPVLCQEQPKTIFIGYINELHYVSSVPEKTDTVSSNYKHLQRSIPFNYRSELFHSDAQVK